MENEFKILMVCEKSGIAESISKIYGSEYHFGECDYTDKAHKAIQSLRDVDYDICFIADSYEMSDIKALFSDYQKLEKTHLCIFIQVRDKLDPDFDRSSLEQEGFITVLSLMGTHQDKESFGAALKKTFHHKEIERRKVNVEDALQHALKELDRVAKDRKRGRDRKFNTLSTDFITLQTNFDEEVLTKYFDELSEKAEEAQPQNTCKIDVPKTVLKKELPKLKANTYTGASQRVWNNLLKKYGDSEKKEVDDHKENEEAVSAPDPEE